MHVIGPADVLAASVLIVDDQEANVLLLEQILRGSGYLSVTSTTKPREVCELHRKNRYDLIVLDLQMPGMDGFAVMEGLKEVEPGGYLPVLVLTGQPAHKLRALQAGAKDFVSKPFELAEVLVRVRNMLEVRLLDKALREANRDLEERVRERTAALHESHSETVFTMMRAAEGKDEGTGSHVQRISYYCVELSRMLGLDETFIDRIFLASPMHDIGKIAIPDRILLKEGSLTEEEWAVMKSHTWMGAKILGASHSPYLRMGAEIALNHHELWDGSGYPAGRRGEEIPLTARIMSICDVYDALRSLRPYKPPLEHSTTMEIMSRGDGRTRRQHFDPALLALFEENHGTFRDIFEAHRGEPPVAASGSVSGAWRMRLSDEYLSSRAVGVSRPESIRAPAP